MKKILLVLALLSCLIATPLAVFAQDSSASEADKNGFLNDKTIDVLQKFQDATGFRSFGGQSNPDAINKPGLDNITGLLFTIIDIAKYAVGTIAVIFLVVSIIRLISAGVDKGEEAYENLKKSVTFLIIAIIIIISSDFLFKNVFVVANGDFLANTETAKVFANAAAGEIRGIYNLVQAFLATIAVLMLVFAAFRLVTNAGNDEVVEKGKKQLMYAVAGLLIVGLSEFVVKDILFVDQGQTLSTENAKLLMVKLTNFITGFVSTVAVVSFFYAGYLYIFSATSEDNSEKVKKIIFGGIIGILVSAGAFAIVNTVIKLDQTSSPKLLQNQLDKIR